MNTSSVAPQAGETMAGSARERLLALRKRQHMAPPGSSIPARTGHEPLRCSPAQQALWMLECVIPRSGVYNIVQAIRLEHTVDALALQRALQALVERQEALRTAFVELNGSPVPVLAPHAELTLVRVDAKPCDNSGLLQRLSDDALRPFDLAVAPLMRASLWEVQEGEQVLLLVIHHIVADGWSVQVLARELNALYAQFAPAGANSSVPLAAPSPIQFTDWAAWQQEPDQSERRTSALQYWRHKLDALVPLEFPADRPRPLQTGYTGATVRLRLAPDTAHGLRQLALQHNATLFMVLLTAFKVLLLRHTNQHDVVVGTPVAGRDRPELEGLIGYFVNSLVLRTDLSGNPSFTQALGRVRQTALDAFTHQDLPFVQLVAELSPQRDLARNPLYQVSFALNNQPAPSYALGGSARRPIALPLDIAKFDLGLTFVDLDGELEGVFEYSTELFERTSIEALGAHLQVLLAGVLADAHQPIERLPLLSDAERQRMLVEWNQVCEPVEATPPAVHIRVARQARRTPEAVALVCRGEHLSYQELELRAQGLAASLRTLGVGPEVMVGICLERSPELLVAMLAVLKAGGALVPMDAGLPPQRLAFILQDTQAPVLITHTSLLSRLELPCEAMRPSVCCVDRDVMLMGPAPEPEAALHAPPEQLAAVIYTSGSTGQPKGVLLEHRGWSNHALWMQQLLGVNTSDRFVQITSISFDASLVELFLPLQAGATLVLAGPDEHRDMAALARLLRDDAITVLQMVPSALRALLAEPGFAAGSLRRLICGGEALDVTLANALQQRLPATRIGNFYGPTEAAIDTTQCEWPVAAGASRTVPIGRPVPQARCYVLDSHLQPVPVGTAGELYIGGAGLARGYLGREEQTAARFIANPFVAGERLYRSGDLVRYRADGCIEYCGRADSQIKLNGYRIELGEIEAALASLPGVLECAVLAREDEPGRRRLVAYVCGTSTLAEAAELKRGLAMSLPGYMVPTLIVRMPRLPTLTNGKLDRAALPAPMQIASETPLVEPRNATEQAIWAIWHEVLGAKRFGVQDNFFDLGGHSLLASQVLARLRARLGVEMALRDLFSYPTLAQLAEHVARADKATDRQLESIGPRKDRDSAPLSYSQQGMWLVQQLNPLTTAYNMTLALRLQGALDAALLESALRSVVQRHEAFRTRFEAPEGVPLQRVAESAPFAMVQHDLDVLDAPAREVQAQRIRDALVAQPFDLAQPGLYRICLLRMSAQEHVLIWVIHHSIGDQWSNGILQREVAYVYTQLLQGRTGALPRLPLSYADFAAWQRDEALELEQAPALDYWRTRLEGLAPLALPHDFTARGLPSGRGSSVAGHLPPAAFEALQRLSAEHGATTFMALLACFKLLLSRLCGQTDIAVGSPVANRTRLEFEPLVGTMVNTLVLRTELAAARNFIELLVRVRDTALAAFTHQGLPFERLVEELGSSRTQARSPLVQVLFNVISSARDSGEWVGLRVSPLAFTATAAQFDLGMTVEPSPSGEVRLSYSTDVFSPVTVARLLESYLTLVQAVLADPARPLDEIATLGETQSAALAGWNDTALSLPAPARLDLLLDTSLAKHGERVALRDDSRQLSYSELRSRSHRLARHLRTHGIARGARVGLCVERSPEMVVAQLAILQAGAAYVPLDPAYPTQRLESMVQHAQLACVITESALDHVLDWPPQRRVLLDHDAATIASCSDASLPPDDTLDARSEDPAYVIYTSGSTGRPKGVTVSHAAVVNFLTSMIRQPGLESTDVLVAVTTLSFDISVLELLAPLCVGAQVVLARREQAVDGQALRHLVEHSGATLLQATPSTWRMLIAAGWAGSRRFKALIGGEALPGDLAQQLLERCGALWNMYGPTETTVWATCWRVERPQAAIRIGLPIANTKIHILDAAGRLLPIGAMGEICIAGAGVALGYLHQPELTAARFVPNPFEPGARMYRTGDLGRWCHDGRLEHLGRLDRQVKLRGHRIEPGEVEFALAGHPHVAQATVIVREDVPGDARLVAYVVAKPGVGALPPLREHLRACLPEYMLPQHYVSLASMPLLPNGKIALDALPAPSREELPGSADIDGNQPHTPVEIAVAAVWQELLGVARVDLNDNFFDLGGHSLLAARAVHEVEKRTGLKLSLRSLIFESLGQLCSKPSLGQTFRATAAGALASEPGRLGRLVRALTDFSRR